MKIEQYVEIRQVFAIPLEEQMVGLVGIPSISDQSQEQVTEPYHPDKGMYDPLAKRTTF